MAEKVTMPGTSHMMKRNSSIQHAEQLNHPNTTRNSPHASVEGAVLVTHTKSCQNSLNVFFSHGEGVATMPAKVIKDNLTQVRPNITMSRRLGSTKVLQ